MVLREVTVRFRPHGQKGRGVLFFFVPRSVLCRSVGSVMLVPLDVCRNRKKTKKQVTLDHVLSSQNTIKGHRLLFVSNILLAASLSVVCLLRSFQHQTFNAYSLFLKWRILFVRCVFILQGAKVIDRDYFGCFDIFFVPMKFLVSHWVYLEVYSEHLSPGGFLTGSLVCSSLSL